MARPDKRSNAKRANRPNPREDRNIHHNNRSFNNTTVGGAPEPRMKKKVELLPRNLRQEEYIDLLSDTRKDVIFAMGPAGTGKSYIATLYAIQQLQAGNIGKIIISRPAVSTDESHGFLPGTLTEKLAPWCRPILDILKEFYSPVAVEKMIADEVIELAPLGFLRGRTFKNAIVILDESQSATDNQMKMVLTRIGEGSRIFVTGDIAQCERGFYESNGLKDFIKRFEGRASERIAVTYFDQTHIERHPVIDEILTIYGE